MKTLFPTRTNAVLSRSSVLAAVALFCFYSAGTNPLQAGPSKARSVASVSPMVQIPYRDLPEHNPAYMALRREYLKRLFGTFPPGVSPAEYARNVAAARALPSSPLMGGRWEPVSPQSPDTIWPPWSFPIAPPISTYATYGGDASAMIHAIGTHSTDSDIVYAGNYGGLVKSTDGGTNWQYISDTWISQEVSSIAVDPNASDYVYVGTGRNNVPAGAGVYRSFNGGTSWTRLGATEFEGSIITKVAIDPNASGSQSATTLYVSNGYSATSGFWRSTNSGSSWTRLRNVAIYDIAIDPSTNPSVLYTSESDGVHRGVYSTQSQSYVFTRIYVSPVPEFWGVLRVVSGVPYYLSYSGDPLANRLYKYSVANQQWTEIPTLCGSLADYCVPGQPIHPAIFAVDPNNPDIILIGNVILFRTTNATAQNPIWTNMAIEELHVDQRALEFSAAQSGLVYSGHDGGISKSQSSGAGSTWTNLNENLPGVLLYSIALSQDDSMMSGTQDNGAVFTYQRAPWDIKSGGDGARAIIHPTESSIAYFNMAGHRAFYLSDHLLDSVTYITPDQLELGGDPYCHSHPAFSLNPSSPENVLAACERVVRSTEGGVDVHNWTTIGPAVGWGGSYANTVSAVCEAPSNPSVIYAAANEWGRHIYVTSDAHKGEDASWTEITSDLPTGTEIWGLAVHATDPDTAYVSCNTGVFRTTDMGDSWENLTTGALNIFYPSLALDPNDPDRIFAASRYAGVIGSIDGGDTWTSVGNELPAGLYITQLSFNGVSRQLALATYGRGAYLLDLDDVSPEVSITAPGQDDVVSGTVVVSATASDNHRVAGVQFKVNGSPIGSEDTSEPYSINWNTTPLSPDNYTLTAVARDPAENLTTSDPVTVKVVDNE